jgi:hypothetical protein
MARTPRRTSASSSPAAPDEAGGAGAPCPPALRLAALVSEVSPERWVVRLGAREREAALDASVDPALLREALGEGGRVVVEDGDGVVIVGTLCARRAVGYDRDGSVSVTARRFEVSATERVTLRTARAYVDLKRADVEVYGHRVVTRAREVAKILARLVSLN